jgi:hypothetical protein
LLFIQFFCFGHGAIESSTTPYFFRSLPAIEAEKSGEIFHANNFPYLSIPTSYSLKAPVLALMLGLCAGSYAQSVSTLIGARQAGMGYASSALADEWSLFNNIGGIGKIKQHSVGFAYEVTPNLIGSNRMAAAWNTTTRWFNASVGAFRFGDNIYSEQVLSTGIGNQFGITSLGAKVNYIQYRAEGFGTQSTVSVDFGGITELTKQLSIGAYITNLTQASLQTRDGDRLPTKLTLGLGITPSEKIFITTEIEKDLDYKPTWRTGLEYAIYKSVFARTGFQFNPSNLFFGLGYKKKNLKVDYAVRFNSLLGTTHQASAVYLISNKEKK